MRFDFGANWHSFASLIDDSRISASRTRLMQLLRLDRLDGMTFFDVGCGSGLHSMAALQLGADVTAIDLDPVSVATAKRLLDGTAAQVAQADALNLKRFGVFDIVYSWGVLHHTGDMRAAIIEAAQHVKVGGRLALALYGKTPYCGFWARVKRWYITATPEQRAISEKLYIRAFSFYLRLRGKRLADHIRHYRNKRGMDFLHDVRDWLGGYPYESIRPNELRSILHGFRLEHQKVARRSGLFGSGCDEYLFRRL